MASVKEMQSENIQLYDGKTLSNCARKTDDLDALLDMCLGKLEEAETSLDRIHVMETLVSDKGFEVQKEINRTADGMITTIQQRKCELNAQVKSTMKAKQKALTSQKSKLTSYIQSLKSSINYSKDVLDSTESDASEWKTALAGLLKEALDEEIDTEPAANENFHLTLNEEEYVFDLEEFFTHLCSRKRSNLCSSRHLKC